MNTFKTPKGTVLALMNLKGKDYLPVAQRIVWFREEKPDWSIETRYLELNAETATCRAEIKDEEGRIIATAHKTETYADFKLGHQEKAETSSIGRALALCGYGTQFCADELDEGERIVDAPRESNRSTTAPNARESFKSADISNAGDYVIRFGKFKGLAIKAVEAGALKNWLTWLAKEPKQSDMAREAMKMSDYYLKTLQQEMPREGGAELFF